MKMLIIAFFVFTAINSSAQFKNIKWGMNKAQVIRLDSLKNPVDSGNFLTVIENDGYFNNEKIYEFEKDSLVSVAHIRQRVDKKANTEKYTVDEFKAVYSAFVNTGYGEPYKMAFGGPTYAAWKTPSHKLLIEVVYNEKDGFALRTDYIEPNSIIIGLEK
ncbi:hypothetical protein [Sphingobacterium suaedae]|uniref:Uncharacterized protein n=1 Tax=Sphingobacterium suaedae TaxID=1686402 RepID=A0ABW5KJY3_9SPHI